jgi:acyl-coenzyme A synthetase/AMP-(fatty) acid ligase
MAFVILKATSSEKWKGRHTDFEVELKQHARSRLPGFACPEWVQVVEELPVRFLGS